MQATYTIFNRNLVRQRRNRAAARIEDSDFLLRILCERMADRLPDVMRIFPVALDVGAHHGLLADYIKGLGGIETLVQVDMSEVMMSRSQGLHVVADDEFLPFAQNSFDLVMSVNSLHWVNDLPGTLIQINRILKPGGMFIAMLPGGETLKELRQSLEQAEMAQSGGLSPRVSPFIDVKDAGSLLQRAGFILPVTDSDTLTISYEDPLKLLQDLRNAGETNALITASKKMLRRSLLLAAMDYYRQHFSEEGRVNASFEVVTMTGWKSDNGK